MYAEIVHQREIECLLLAEGVDAKLASNGVICHKEPVEVVGNPAGKFFVERAVAGWL